MLLKSILSIFFAISLCSVSAQSQSKQPGPPSYPDILKVGKGTLIVLESELSEDSLRTHRSAYGRSTTLRYIDEKRINKIRSSLEEQGINISEVSRMTRASAKVVTDSIFFANMEVRDSSDYRFYITLSEEFSVTQYMAMDKSERILFRGGDMNDLDEFDEQPDAEDTASEIELILNFVVSWDESISLNGWNVRSLKDAIATYEDPRYDH